MTAKLGFSTILGRYFSPKRGEPKELWTAWQALIERKNGAAAKVIERFRPPEARLLLPLPARRERPFSGFTRRQTKKHPRFSRKTMIFSLHTAANTL
jgi:hypothetical protein